MIAARDESLAQPPLRACDLLGDAAGEPLTCVEGDIHNRLGVWTESQWRPAPCHCGAAPLPANHVVEELDFTNGEIPGPIGCRCHVGTEDRTTWFAQEDEVWEEALFWPTAIGERPIEDIFAGTRRWEWGEDGDDSEGADRQLDVQSQKLDADLLQAPMEVVNVPGRYVDIYLSAGPRENYAEPLPWDYRSCTQDNTANCSMYQIRWDHWTKTGVVTKIEPAKNLDMGSSRFDIGYTEPAVSPSGRWLLYLGVTAYRDMSGNPTTAVGTSIVRHDMDTGTSEEVYYHAAGSQQPQYPVWIEEPPSKMPFFWNTATGVDIADTATVWADFDLGWFELGFPVFGPDSDGVETSTSFEDANVHENAADRGTIRVVTFGGAVGDPLAPTSTEHIPQVSDLRGGHVERVHIGEAGLTECHHPAFNLTGNQILCTGQEPPENFDDGFGLQARRRLFYFTWDAATGEWTNGAPLIGPLSVADFQAIATDITGAMQPDVFPPLTDKFSYGECRNYHWKFAEWCGSDQYVVATVYCTDNLGRANVDPHTFGSRVVLIDLDADDDTTGTPAAYHDLTAWIEDYEGGPAGSFNGVFSTCHRVAGPG